MSTTNWVPLWSDTLRSSLWSLGRPDEPEEKRWQGRHAKLLFMTMLMMADPDGFLRSSYGALAYEARLTEEETRSALELLEGPDPDSRNKDNEGRRVAKVDGGWVILNHEWHWTRMREERDKRQNRYRQAAFRERRKLKDRSPDELREEERSLEEDRARAEAWGKQSKGRVIDLRGGAPSVGRVNGDHGGQ